MNLRFLVLHGLGGSGPEHWQTWLVGRLREAGHPVRYPDLPDCDTPCPDRWGQALREEVAALGPGPGSVVVCHSLACVLWLRHARATASRQRVERVLLVAPPCAEAGVPEIEGFFPVAAKRDALDAAAGATRLVCGDDDPYCPRGAATVYGAAIGLPTDVVPGGGHLNPETGYGPWPAVEAWAYGAKNGVET